MRITNSQTYQEKRDTISHDWLKFFKELNYLPIFIPNLLENVDDFLIELNLDGIIISGGDNLGDDPIRDQTENQVINYGVKNKIPMLGVCRGMQSLNIFFGGKVNLNQAKNHVGKRHNVRFVTNRIPDLGDVLEVNSFHNNMIAKHDIPDDFKILALCDEDETVEGIIHSKLPIIGVMWHPEREESHIQLKLMDFFKKNEN
jgi:putative glutamine amidotransferase